MKKITSDSQENMLLLSEIIEEYGLTGEQVLNLFTNWHGTQLCTKEFLENTMECEGYEL